MEQVLIAGKYTLLNIGTTEYNAVAGQDEWYPVGDRHKVNIPIPSSGKLKNLRVELNDVPGTGTYTFTLHRAVGTGGFANTALTCTVGAAATQADDMVNEVAVAAGDIVVLECNPDAPDNARYAIWSMVFEGDTANESLLFTGGQVNTGINQYYSIMKTLSGGSIEDDARVVCPTSGTIKNLYVQLHTAVTGGDYRVTLRIGGVSKALTVTITDGNRTGNYTTDIAVSAGDVLTMMCEPLNTPTNALFVAIGMTFVADTDGESVIMGGSIIDLDDTATEYNLLCGGWGWGATESEREQLAQASVLKDFYVLLSGSPGAGKNYTFTVRDTGGSTSTVVTIQDAGTTGNKTDNDHALIDGDKVSLMVVPTGTPTVRDVYWGLVSFIEPAVTGIENKSANMAAKMMAAGVL